MNQLTAASPHAIIMIGIPGAGKSTFASRFADTFQAPIVSQTQLERSYQLSVEQSAALRDTILAEYMKTRRTVLIDGGLDDKASRETLVKKLIKADYRPLIVWVQTDTAQALRRAVKPYPIGSGLTHDSFNEAVDHFDPPAAKEKTVVISGKHTYTSQLKIVLKQLATPVATPTPVSPPRPAPQSRQPRRFIS